jgi:hypothetical protein
MMPLAKETVFSFFYELEKWFRLNPQWEVLSLENGKRAKENEQFTLRVKYDRTEKEVLYKGTVEEFRDNQITVRLDAEVPRLITVKLNDAENGMSILSYEEVSDVELPVEEKRNLNLWIKSVANYILLSRKKTLPSRIWKWIVDKIWLKMSPSGRRIAFFIVVAEAATLVFFILLLAWLLIFKKI